MTCNFIRGNEYVVFTEDGPILAKYHSREPPFVHLNDISGLHEVSDAPDETPRNTFRRGMITSNSMTYHQDKIIRMAPATDFTIREPIEVMRQQYESGFKADMRK